MRTVIHIGQHKTGTTSIQHFLMNNRASLEKYGLYVPDSICGYNQPSHFILNVYSLDKNRYSPMKEKLLANKEAGYFMDLRKNLENDIARHYQKALSNNCKDIVWSNEGLYLLNSVDEYNRLLELFLKYSAEIVCVCCFREIESYRKSYIQQLMKQGLSPSPDKESYRYHGADSWLFDYDRKKNMLCQVFEKVIYLSYNPEDMVRAFMEALGYSVSGTESIRLNVTLQ